MTTIQCVACIVIAVCLSGVATIETGYEFPDYRDHPCVRQCTENEQPKVCKYDLLIENYYVMSRACFDCPFNQSHCYYPHCVTANGVQRAIKTANRMLPGPSIEVCEGDVIEVTVDNRMISSEGTTIHWHGILQRDSPYMDGLSYVTQCMIPAQTKFTYRFRADNPGTHFWHSHMAFQRADGLFGSLIVRRPPRLEPHNQLYDFDLPEHVMTVTDWFSDVSVNAFLDLSYANRPLSVHILINGRGLVQGSKDTAGSSLFTPRSSFTVQPGKKFRFRVINSSSGYCPFQISVDNHRLTMIASDGSAFEPFLVDSFITYPGERYDFILHADKTDILRNYWIRAAVMADCTMEVPTQTAILKYEGATTVLPLESTPWSEAERKCVKLNSGNSKRDETHVDISRMRSVEPDDETFTSEPDRKIYLTLDLFPKNNPVFYDPVYYPVEAFNRSEQILTPQINHITLSTSSSPLLSHFDKFHESDFCNAETISKPCEHEFCSCLHGYQLRLGDLVELVIIDEAVMVKSSHPVHLHGYRFRVVGLGRVGKVTSLADVKSMDARGELNRTITRAPIKDTVMVPYGGYTIIRFRADNPGVWLLHCHNEFHSAVGMDLLFKVGTEKQLPGKPKNFPTCGDWKLED